MCPVRTQPAAHDNAFRRRRPIGVFLLVLVTGSAVFAADSPEVVVQRDVMTPMRDGVCLATDVYLPARDGKPIAEKLPAILERRPYNKDGCGGSGRYYASHGYVFVAQDTRGRYKSEGVCPF